MDSHAQLPLPLVSGNLPDRPGAVQGAKWRSGPLTARTDQEPSETRGKGELRQTRLAQTNENAEPKQQLDFNKHYIGLSDGTHSKNFIYFRPRKKWIQVVIPNEWTEGLATRFEDAGIDADQKDDRLRFTLSPAQLKKHRELVAAVIHEVVVAKSS